MEGRIGNRYPGANLFPVFFVYPLEKWIDIRDEIVKDDYA